MCDDDSIKRKIASLLKQPSEKLGDDVPLTDLVVDSFILIEMVIELQEEFGVRLLQEDMKHVKTVGDLTHLLAARATTVTSRP
jgi:acyl carrier protein